MIKSVSIFLILIFVTGATVTGVVVVTQHHTIAASSGDGGEIDPSGNIDVWSWQEKKFTIIPNEGYVISAVYVDDTNIGAIDEYTFSKVTEDRRIHAEFKYSETPEPLNIVITTAPDKTTYVLNSSFDPTGMVVMMVFNDGSGSYVTSLCTYSPSTFTTVGIVDVIVSCPYDGTTFTTVQKVTIQSSPVVYYTLTATAATGGSISPFGSIEVESGSNKTFTISPSLGFNVSNVSVDGISKGNVSTYTFYNVVCDHTIQAYFSETGLSDIVTSISGTEVQNGHIVLFSESPNVSISNLNNEMFHLDNIVPGISQTATVVISNNDTESLAGCLCISNLVGDAEIASNLLITVQIDSQSSITMSVKEFYDSSGTSFGTILPGNYIIVNIIIELPVECGNGVQGQSINFIICLNQETS